MILFLNLSNICVKLTDDLKVTHEQLRFPGNKLNHIQDRINHFFKIKKKKKIKILLHYICHSIVDNIIVVTHYYDFIS
jgi:hypothetical protein